MPHPIVYCECYGDLNAGQFRILAWGIEVVVSDPEQGIRSFADSREKTGSTRSFYGTSVQYGPSTTRPAGGGYVADFSLRMHFTEMNINLAPASGYGWAPMQMWRRNAPRRG